MIDLGFVEAMEGRLASSYWTEVKNALAGLQNEGRCNTLYSSGHSLGAAMSQLFGHCLAQPDSQQPPSLIGTKSSSEVVTYAFASPAFQAWKFGTSTPLTLPFISGKRFYARGKGPKVSSAGLFGMCAFQWCTDLVTAMGQWVPGNNYVFRQTLSLSNSMPTTEQETSQQRRLASFQRVETKSGGHEQI